MATTSEIVLPGLDCGLCGFPSCDEMAGRLDKRREDRGGRLLSMGIIRKAKQTKRIE